MISGLFLKKGVLESLGTILALSIQAALGRNTRDSAVVGP